jgi:transcription-repair coupling factor (superfamily II helicase)
MDQILPPSKEEKRDGWVILSREKKMFETNETSPFEQWMSSEPWKRFKSIGLTGLKGSSKAYLLSLWGKKEAGPLVIVAPSLQRAESLMEDLQFFGPNSKSKPLLFSPWETLPYDEIPPHPEIIRERVMCLFSLMSEGEGIVISPIRALMQKVFTPADFRRSVFSLRVGEEGGREGLIRFLQESGYASARVVEERGDFSLRGAIVDLYAPPYEAPLRVEFDGDRLSSIRCFEPEGQRSLPESDMERAVLLPARDVSKDLFEQPLGSFFDYLKGEAVLFIDEMEEVEKEAHSFSRSIEEHYQKALAKKRPVLPPGLLYLTEDELALNLKRFRTASLQEGPLAPLSCEQVFAFETEANEDLRREMNLLFATGKGVREASPFSVFLKGLARWQEKGMRVFIVSHTLGQAGRLRELLSHYEVVYQFEKEIRFSEALEQPWEGISLIVGSLSSGFKNPMEGWTLFTEEEIFGERRRLREGRSRSFLPQGGAALSSYQELHENDFIVHVDFGVGIYRGLRHLKIGGVGNDYLLLEYLDGDKIYVPVDRLNLIQHYIGSEGGSPRLDKLGSQAWQRAKRKAKEAASEMVKELLDLYAARQVFEGYSFPPVDQFYREFEATFEYEETPDQSRALDEVMKDMESPKPMDRLICGDVGYGKTEVAIRATYRAVMSGKQVVILVPTTILAQQHYQTFRDRFKTYPVVIEVLSRFKGPRDQKEVLQRLSEGKVDIILGTHRLLQRDVAFRDLGLVVVDEEHRFGVTHKEKLKQMRKLVDVMTLTATPIPRTLQMALTGLRDLTLIQTPPENRLSIRTFVIRYDDDAIREAVQREFQRGGQVFFVHPRIQTIYALANHLKRIIPEATLAVAHGQMKGSELERVMLRFVRKEYNLLVSTNIIESGLDIPTANTILINHAEKLGLADLHQLRGRVGRGSHQAYAYLLIPGDLVLSRDALRRLQAIQEMSELGSGFKLAIQDLEIRGAGNLLGPSQSGYIAAVGFEFYTQLMEKAVRELKGEEMVEEITPEIQFHLPAFIPEAYVEDPGERLRLYRRLSFFRSDEEVDCFKEELVDRFGKVPLEAEHLIEVIKVKILLSRLAIKKLEERPSQMVLTFDQTTKVSPRKLVELVRRGEGRYQLTPDSRLIVAGSPALRQDPFGTAKNLLQALA